MKCRVLSSRTFCFTLALLWINAFTGTSAEIIGIVNAELLVELYKINPENINSIGHNLTTLARWVTTTRPLALPGPRLDPKGYTSTPLTWAIGRIYNKVKNLISDLEDPNLWSNTEKLALYGFDQQTVLTMSITAPEFFQDRVVIARDFLEDLRDVVWWEFEAPPLFYGFDGPRQKKKEIMMVWEVIHDMAAYIVSSRPGGIKLNKIAPLMAYIMNLGEIKGSQEGTQLFSFPPQDVLTFETGLNDIAAAIDTFISDRDWDSIDTSYRRLIVEFDTSTAPFWGKLDQEYEFLRRFIYDYMMIFWTLRKRVYTFRQDIYTWSQNFNSAIEWRDTDNPNLRTRLDAGSTENFGS
ncbi:hypothetical protein TWF718_010155 [Orbilia javanica]|uniref:Uncharacterized protein n=1 Tax=Orbilia javanica TaxID=47235 RepID=A0AAN8R9T8_9PEZI